jgi:N-acetylglutamate synthase-like GNAT family acetyltransferase
MQLGMRNLNYTISKIGSKEKIPFDLLLLADETIDAIEKYIYHSDVYTAISEKFQPIAVFALFKINEKQLEIKNIAVSEKLQGKGIGTYLINHIKIIAKNEGYRSLIVGTPDCALRQIKFYEQNGFIKYDVKKDFYLKNYSNPIFENAIMLRDMLMLKTEL